MKTNIDLSKPQVFYSGPGFDEPWCAWIPPRGPQDYDGDDPAEAAILAPYGDTYWPTREEAEAFVALVLGGGDQ